MITTLCTPTYKAAYAARKAAEKPQESLPVTSHMLLTVQDGRLLIVPFRWTERAEHAQAVSARIDTKFSTCVPAKPFVDWLRVTQNKQPKHPRPTFRNRYAKPEWVDDRIVLDLDPTTQSLTIKAGNTRATFICLPASEWPAMETTQ